MDSSNTILVTGGAGYIGSRACKALAQVGFKPISYDNLVYSHRWAVRWGPLEDGDIGDRARLDAVIARYRPAAVMHFAAYASYFGKSVSDPGNYYRNNVAGTLARLEAMRDHGIGQLVFSSTCATYGEPQRVPIDEDHPQRPINPYGASKLMIERMLADFAAAHGLRWIALRYFNAAEADPDGEIGGQHDPKTHLNQADAGRYCRRTPLHHRLRRRLHPERHLHPRPNPCLGPGRCPCAGATVIADWRSRRRLQPVQRAGVLRAAHHRARARDHRPRDPGCPRPQAPRRPTEAGRGREPGASGALGCEPRYPSLSAIIESAWRRHQNEQAMSPSK